VRIIPSRQRNAASEGVAPGTVVVGHDSIEFDKVRVDLAFEGAWPHRTGCSQVDTDIRER
jgi:hypothetical protein